MNVLAHCPVCDREGEQPCIDVPRRFHRVHPHRERMEAEIERLSTTYQGAVEALREAIDLLDNARPDFGDPLLKRRWAARRKALRAKWGQ